MYSISENIISVFERFCFSALEMASSGWYVLSQSHLLLFEVILQDHSSRVCRMSLIAGFSSPGGSGSLCLTIVRACEQQFSHFLLLSFVKG